MLTYYKNDQIKKFLEKNYFGIKANIIREKKKLGTAKAIQNIYNKIEKDFLVINADSIFDININNFVNFSRSKKSLLCSALTKKKNISNYSYKIKGNKVYDFGKNESPFVNGGIYYFKKSFFSKKINNYCDIDQYILQRIYNKEINNKFYCKYFNNAFLDIGTKKN